VICVFIGRVLAVRIVLRSRSQGSRRMEHDDGSRVTLCNGV
jgi:hypothetical protein